MLSPGMVREIQRLIAADNWSLRRIARELQVSRGTVLAIAHGRRRTSCERRTHDDAEYLIPEPSGPPRRCPSCGGMVQMPCVLCGVRALAKQSSRPRSHSAPEGLLGVGLVGEHRARYEEVRARKIREMALSGQTTIEHA